MVQLRLIKIFLTLVIIFSYEIIAAQNEPKKFRDTLDNAFDISTWLLDVHGFIPVVSPITEPAVGYGAIVAGVFFIPKKNKSTTKFVMPDILGAGVGLTQNGTWFFGAKYSGYWKDDKIRYQGIAGYGDFNLKFYGAGKLILESNPAKFNLNNAFLLQQLLFRIKNSHFYIGGKYTLAFSKITAFEDSKLSEVKPLDFDLVTSALGLITEFENFNNILSPSKGTKIHLGYGQNLEFLGSDRNNGRLTLYAINYLPINKRWFSGLRIESMLASDNTAFYQKPFISLRGVPAMRYQGELTMLVETEQFVNVYKRWSVVGFGGVGTTITSLEKMTQGESAWNIGGGFRYKLARALNLQMGIDIARGPEQTAFYIVFGNAWLK